MKKNYSKTTKINTIKLVIKNNYTVKEAAKEMNISEATIYRWIANHKSSLDKKLDINKNGVNQLQAENLLLKKGLFTKING